jgi:hypothetical protein
MNEAIIAPIIDTTRIKFDNSFVISFLELKTASKIIARAKPPKLPKKIERTKLPNIYFNHFSDNWKSLAEKLGNIYLKQKQ